MKHVNGKMEVKLLDYTKQADRMLVFSKRTRHMDSAASWEQLESDLGTESFQKELAYALGSIGGPLEFVDYTFLLCGVTRALTHQLVRHRVGVSFAQQSMRLTDASEFGYMVPTAIENDIDQEYEYEDCMREINDRYKNLLELGAEPQNARGVLPTNILTNILMKINLRAFAEMLNVRLCIRAQGEFQEVAKIMQQLVIGVHPWSAPLLGPNCVVHNKCKFPLFKACPISNAHPELRGFSSEKKQAVRSVFEKVSGFDPQPKAHK